MEIYLLRHGIAADKTPSGSDRERPLTPAGRKKIKQLATWMKDVEAGFDFVLSSPLVRARQTAEVLTAKMKYQGEVAYSGNLLPGADPKALVKELKKHPMPGSRVLLVGHEPDLSQFASYLLAGKTGLSLELKKGGLCKLEVQTFDAQRCATLVWLVSPKLLGI